MSETKKTIPIQDVWMFLWRLLFTPFVIVVSFILPIFISCFVLCQFVALEVVALFIGLVASIVGEKWEIKENMEYVYDSFRGIANAQYLATPAQWWKAVTDPPVRKALSHAVNWLSVVIWELSSFLVIGFSFKARYHGHAPDSAPNTALLLWVFGPLLLWLVLWLVKKILEFLMRWIFQRPRPEPQS